MKKSLVCILTMMLPMVLAAKSLFLIGDATMAPHSLATSDVMGWAEVMPEYFNDLDVVNTARTGENTRNLLLNNIDQLLEGYEEGDWVLIQLGQNDLRDDQTNMHSSTQEFQDNLIKIVEELHNKGLVTILCTPLAQPFYKGGELLDRMGSYPEMIRRVATAKGVALVDMETISKAWLETIGEDTAKAFYKNISTLSERKEYLLTPAGARKISEMVVNELYQLEIEGLNSHILN